MNAESDVSRSSGNAADRLQWGRVLVNAESPAGTERDAEAVSLQWGRVLVNAESRLKFL